MEKDPPSLLNPTVIVEVTSDSSEDFDRGKKFLHYQGIQELREYVIVSHRERRIDCFHRLGDGRWHLTTHTQNESAVDLPSLNGSFGLAEIYAKIVLDEGRR